MKTINLLLFLALPFLTYPQTDKALSFESTNYDFGNLSKGSKAVATFLFTNTTSKNVEILKIHGENHCLQIDSLSLKTYAPKEKGIIIATYNTNCTGPIRKTLSVFSSGEDNTITLKLTGKVNED